jgi:hypothetical protein
VSDRTIDPAKAAAILMESLASTFADMAFIDVEPLRGPPAAGEAPGSAPGLVEAPIRAAIDVLKPVSCRLEIECPSELKRRIEATLFPGGEDADGQEDSLLEILNVAAGVFLSAYFGAGADVKLELPQYLFFSEGPEGEILAEAVGNAEGVVLHAALRSIRYRY